MNRLNGTCNEQSELEREEFRAEWDRHCERSRMHQNPEHIGAVVCRLMESFRAIDELRVLPAEQ